jgi:large subunit ribosomal protein L29
MKLKAKEIREFKPEERREKLNELKSELMHERGVAAMGGSPPSPGKIRQLRMNIAKILTIMQEEGET